MSMTRTTRPLSPADYTTVGLDQAWGQLGRAGGWWSGRERIAIAEEMRAAKSCVLCGDRKTALSPYSISNRIHEGTALLPAHVVDVIHRMTTDPGRLSQRWFDEAIEFGMRPEEIVEITSLVGVVTIADSLSRALSIRERALPPPERGAPHRRIVSGTRVDRAWVPMVEPGSAEGMLKLMYDDLEKSVGFVFNVARALTAVPEAVRDFFNAFLPNYSTHGPVGEGGLDRVQVELLASATSDWNDCFY